MTCQREMFRRLLSAEAQRPEYAYERVVWEREDTLDPERRLVRIPRRQLEALEAAWSSNRDT